MQCPQCGSPLDAAETDCRECGLNTTAKWTVPKDSSEVRSNSSAQAPPLSEQGFHVATQPASTVPPAASSDSDMPLLSAGGYSAVLELWSDRVIIRRQGVNGLVLGSLKGDNEILLQSISSIEFKESSGLSKGYIQFMLRGKAKARQGLFWAVQDKNAVTFSALQTPVFQALKDAIYRQRKTIMQQGGRVAARTPGTLTPRTPATSPTATSPTAAGSLSPLEELASLRDRGLISDEEFQAKKKQILGL